MPSGHDWIELFRSTFGDVGRADIRLPAQEIAAALAREVRAFRGLSTPEDDVSIAVLRRIG